MTNRLLLVLAVLSVSCGGGSPANPAPSGCDDTAELDFTGALGSGAIVALHVAGAASAQGAQASCPRLATGALTVPTTGALTHLTGTFDPGTGQLAATGGGDALTATFAKGQLHGSVTLGGSAVPFAASLGKSAVVVYCGGFEYPGTLVGNMALVVASGEAVAVTESGLILSGTAVGQQLALTDTGASSTTWAGTLGASSASGTIHGSGGDGTWAASTSACVPVDPAITCPAFSAGSYVTLSHFPTSDAPSPAGGAILPGTYDLTAARLYDGSSQVETVQARERLAFTSTSFRWVGQVKRGSVEELATGGAGSYAAVDGSPAIHVVGHCPEPAFEKDVQYTVDGSTLDEFGVENGVLVVRRYVRISDDLP